MSRRQRQRHAARLAKAWVGPSDPRPAPVAAFPQRHVEAPQAPEPVRDVVGVGSRVDALPPVESGVLLYLLGLHRERVERRAPADGIWRGDRTSGGTGIAAIGKALDMAWGTEARNVHLPNVLAALRKRGWLHWEFDRATDRQPYYWLTEDGLKTARGLA